VSPDQTIVPLSLLRWCCRLAWHCQPEWAASTGTQGRGDDADRLSTVTCFRRDRCVPYGVVMYCISVDDVPFDAVTQVSPSMLSTCRGTLTRGD